MTTRRLRVLIERLPPESATWTALRNSMSAEELARHAEAGEPEKGRWSQQEQLLAAVYDRLSQLQYVITCVNTEKKAKWPEPPEPMRRPGAGPKKKRAQLTSGSAERLFELLHGGAG